MYNPAIELDNDGIRESVIYDPETLTLCIYRKDELISSTGIFDFNMTFNHTGLGKLNYSYDFVKDRNGSVLLHTTYRTLIDDTNDFITNTGQGYYSFSEDSWIEIHHISYITKNGTDYECVEIDGKEAPKNWELIFNQFTQIANTYYEIPTSFYEGKNRAYVQNYIENMN